MIKLLTTALAFTLLLPAGLTAQEDCEVRQEFMRELDASDLEGVLVDVESGALRVTGVDGDRISVRAVLCASDQRAADEAEFVVERRRDAAWIETDLPDGNWRGDYARMDVEIRMPRGLAADIEDGSGEIVVTGIAAVRIDDGSGEIYVEGVPGSVIIEDGSGEIELRDVGPVELDDGSGSIDITGVTGDVLILEDGSGSIDIADVTGSVRIREDGSGSISVVRVGGDFILDDDGSGSVTYRDVQGRVSLPPER